jgi:hypothetical protein
MPLCELICLQRSYTNVTEAHEKMFHAVSPQRSAAQNLKTTSYSLRWVEAKSQIIIKVPTSYLDL